MKRTQLMGLATALVLGTLLTLALPRTTHAQDAVVAEAPIPQGTELEVSVLPWVDPVSVVAVLDVAQAQELVHTLYPHSVFSPEPQFLLHGEVWVYEFVGTEGTVLLDAVTGTILDNASRAPADAQNSSNCSDTMDTCDTKAPTDAHSVACLNDKFMCEFISVPECPSAECMGTECIEPMDACDTDLQVDWGTIDCHNDKFMCAFTIVPECPQAVCMITDPAVNPCPNDSCDVNPGPSELPTDCTQYGTVAFTCVVPIDCSDVVCDARPAYPVDESTPFLCGMLREDGTVGCPDSNDASLPAIDSCVTVACQAVPEPVDLDSECARTPDGTVTCVAPVDCSLVVCDAADAIPVAEAMAFPCDIRSAECSSLEPASPTHVVGLTGINGAVPADASTDLPAAARADE